MAKLPSESAETVKVVTGLPYGCLYVAALSATTLIPLVVVASKSSARPTNVRFWVGTAVAQGNSSNHWSITVEKGTLTSPSPSPVAPPFRTRDSGIAANLWRTLATTAGMLRGQALYVRFTKVGAPTALAGVSLSFDLEVR